MTTTDTTTATTTDTTDNASVPDVTLVITTATTDNASGTDVPSPMMAKVLHAPATTPVRWLNTISQKMGVSLSISQDQADVLAADTLSLDYEALLNRTCGEERLLKALGAITPEEQELLKKTLCLELAGGRFRNTPVFQCIRIKYFTNVCSWLQDREPKVISLQDLLNKIGLSSIYSEIGLGLFEATFPDRYQPWDWDSVEFHRINGEGRGEDISKVYVCVDPYDSNYIDTYPSPWGSCMRSNEWSYDGYSLGTDQCDYDHPVVAYATKDIDLAWVTDKSTGKTLARCLINNCTRTVSRVYAVGLNLGTYDYQKRSQKELKDKLLEFIGLPVDEHTGLKGCRFDPQFLNEDTIVAPYIDGSYYVYDSDTGIIGDTGEFTCTEHNPPVVCRDGKKYMCSQCGDRCDEDDVYFDGEWWCRHCVNEYLIYCVNCDEYNYAADSTYCEETDEWYCDSCAERHLTCCDHCGDWFFNRSVTFCSSDGHTYCDSCMEDKNIYRCDSCGEYYFDDELNEDMCCCHCATEAVDNESENANE